MVTRSLPCIWLMRQAGRYLPEYLKIRDTTAGILDLCYSPAKAAEVTLQPVNRFGVDAAIIFSDILVLPHLLGWDVRFEKGEGPVMSCFENFDDFSKMDGTNLSKLILVYEAIALVKASLPENKDLIGFAGAPWTLAVYLLEGGKSRDFVKSKRLIYENKPLVLELINFLTKHTIEHLIGQIKAGATMIQIFDSWSGILGEQEFEELVINPTKIIVAAIKKLYPNIPVIGFPRASGYLYDQYIDHTGIDIISIDQFMPIAQMKKWQDKIIVQGNLDPIILTTNPEMIKQKADLILNNLNLDQLIFNIGHGIIPITPPENIGFLVNYVKNYYQR